MNPELFYSKLYDILNITPLAFDCGRLCGAACCAPELPGMYLFPGEETLFRGRAGFAAAEAGLPGYGPVKLLSCEGTCDRGLRPLSCRIFPLAPKVAGSIARARLDPRGKAMCPLCNQPLSALSSGFVKAAEAAFTALLAETETEGFLRALSNHIDEYGKPLG
jgi:hypothetical protein